MRLPAVEGCDLEVSGLTKRYGETLALDSIDLVVPKGQICALLGPNGAGKTTLVSIIAGLRDPDAGRVAVGGLDVSTSGRIVRQRVGLAAQDTAVYPTLTVRENIDLFAGLAGFGSVERVERIAQVADTFELDALMDRQARNISGGERRRLHTAMALVHRPALLLLDEPTTGVDVSSRSRLLDAVGCLAREDGATILYSTHYLPEVEVLKASVCIVDRGRVRARGSLDELVAEFARPRVELVFEGDAPQPPASLNGRSVVSGSRLLVESPFPAKDLPVVLDSLGGECDRLRSIDLAGADLDSVFMAVIGRPPDGESDFLDAAGGGR